MNRWSLGLLSLAWLVMCGTTIADEPIVVELWPGKPPGPEIQLGEERDTSGPNGRSVAGEPVIRLGDVSTPTITVMRPAADAPRTKTAVVICPGGGHHILAWDLEGTEVAEWLNKIGVTAILLKYRVPARNRDRVYESAVQDAQRAMRIARANAEAWDIDPERIGILGFSAGGQTAAMTSVMHRESLYDAIDATDQLSTRPNFAILVYPAWLIRDDNAALLPEVVIDEQTPPMFLAHAFDDGVRVENSLLLSLACKKVGVPVDLHVYATGGHGFGLRPTDEPCTRWPEACTRWLQRSGWLATE
ncbi:MAG: alpha/beta hydrolase [Planctomycetales bacterium]|nr:alpha/beta hydrolase [Planctomycetales bacterium]